MDTTRGEVSGEAAHGTSRHVRDWAMQGTGGHAHGGAVHRTRKQVRGGAVHGSRGQLRGGAVHGTARQAHGGAVHAVSSGVRGGATHGSGRQAHGEAVRGTGGQAHGRAVHGAGRKVRRGSVPNLPKRPAPVWEPVPVPAATVSMSYRTFRSVRHRYRCCTELTEVSCTSIDVVPDLPKRPVPVWKSVAVPAKTISMAYRTYRSGIDVVPN